MVTNRLTLFRTKITPSALLENFGPGATSVAIVAEFRKPIVNIRLTGAAYGPDCYWTGEFAPDELQHVADCRDVTELSISGVRWSYRPPDFGDDSQAKQDYERCCKVNDAYLQIIGTLPTLKSLRIAGADGISPAGLKALHGLPALRTLGITSSQLTDEHLKEIGTLTKLDSLDLTENRLTNEGMRHLNKLSVLTFLNLTDCEQIDGEAITSLGKLPKLKFLDVSGTKIGRKSPELDEANPNLQLINYRASAFVPRMESIQVISRN